MAKRLIVLRYAVLSLVFTTNYARAGLPFVETVVDPDGGHAEVGDINGDGMNDIVVHHEKYLAWLEYPGFRKYFIRRGNFSGDRFALADMDSDGDIDVLSGMRMDNNQFPIAWYENPGIMAVKDKEWNEHVVGDQGGYIKDLMVADMNGDGKSDVVGRSHEHTRIHFHKHARSYQYTTIGHPPKEGMALADLDRDGDIDVILNGFWLETPANAETGEYVRHTISDKWFTQNTGTWQDNSASVAVGDIDGDNILDVAFSHSEKAGWAVAWYSVDQTEMVKNGPWQEHIIAAQFDWCETLRLGDIDHDGHLDMIAAKFERDRSDPKALNAPPFPVVAFYNTKGDGRSWERQTISESGTYAATLADVGSDGDLDIVGPRTYWKGPMVVWTTNTQGKATRSKPGPQKPNRKLSLERWHYIEVDDSRDLRSFGLAMGDLTGDGYRDIVAGRWFYRNPRGDMTGAWQRIALPEGMDSIATTDVNANDRGDIIALRNEEQFWLEADDRKGSSWKAHKIGSLPTGNHGLGSQEYALAQIIPGGKPEIVIAAEGVWYLRIPEKPESGEWPAVRISAQGGGYGAGDIDGDGLLDVAGSVKRDAEGEIVPGTRHVTWNNSQVCWWKNPGDGSGGWKRFAVGLATQADRYAIADVNEDNRADIIVSEERYPGTVQNANLLWFEQPADPRQGEWRRHIIVTQTSMNSLDVADMDSDGHMDVITCEHKMPDGKNPVSPNERLQIWQNDGKGSFTSHLVDVGKECHLGAQVSDLDEDGDLDIASTAWRDFQFLRLWRNDAITKGATGGHPTE